MRNTLDSEPLDDHLPIRDATDAQAPEPSMYGAISGRIVVGRYVLQVGETSGAVLREAASPERPHIRPRPTPILLRPRSIRGLLNRRAELAAAVSALDAGLPVEVSGEPGIGKTAVLRQLAHHSPAASFVDGLVYLSARHQASADLLQLLFDAFYESDTLCKPTEAEIRRGLHEKRALILLDDVTLTEHELERVLDIAPRSAFAVVTRERRLLGEVRSVPLTGLPAEDALALLEREIERPLEETELSAAADLCAAVGGHPLRILQAAALIRERVVSRNGWGPDVTPEGLVTDLLASLDDKHRPALSVLAALPGVPLQAQHISGLAEIPDIESSLTMLVRRGLVVSGESRYRLAAGVGDRLRRTEDLKPGVNRAITYFTAWAERHRRDPDKLLEVSEALLRVQQCAADARRWGEVLRLGRLLEGALAIGARWGAWALTPEQKRLVTDRLKAGRSIKSGRGPRASASQAWRARRWGRQ
jgi:NB-ARC domain